MHGTIIISFSCVIVLELNVVGLTFYVYLAECGDGSLYCGWTNDLEKRIEAHNCGKGAKYTKRRGPVRLVYSEGCAGRSEAMKREHAIKRLSRKEKELLAFGSPKQQ